MTQNKKVLTWLEEMKALTKPEKVVWIDGSEEQLEALRAESVASGEMIKLNQEKLPGCYYHRTAENDVARVEERTFICTPTKEEAGPINNWMAPDEMYAKLNKLYDGSMIGRTMYIIPYSMGPIGSPFSKIGIELTDSIYVVLNMNIMTRIGVKVMEALGDDGDFVKCLHAKKDVNPDERYIVHFPQDNTIMSVNSAYGGNVLLVGLDDLQANGQCEAAVLDILLRFQDGIVEFVHSEYGQGIVFAHDYDFILRNSDAVGMLRQIRKQLLGSRTVGIADQNLTAGVIHLRTTVSPVRIQRKSCPGQRIHLLAEFRESFTDMLGGIVGNNKQVIRLTVFRQHQFLILCAQGLIGNGRIGGGTSHCQKTEQHCQPQNFFHTIFSLKHYATRQYRILYTSYYIFPHLSCQE